MTPNFFRNAAVSLLSFCEIPTMVSLLAPVGFINALEIWEGVLADGAGDFEKDREDWTAGEGLLQREFRSVHRGEFEVRGRVPAGNADIFFSPKTALSHFMRRRGRSLLDDFSCAEDFLGQAG